MQNSDTVTSKTDKLFLLPNAAARLKRRDGGFDLTSAGLMSLIAACGGSDGGSTDNTPPVPPNYVDIEVDGATVRKYNDAIDPVVGIASNDLISINSFDLTASEAISGNIDGKAIIVLPIKVSSHAEGAGHTRATSFKLDDGPVANRFLVVANNKYEGQSGDISYGTNSVGMKYGDLSGGPKDDFFLASGSAGASAIVWDYDPETHAGKIFNLAGLATGEVGLGEEKTTVTYDNANINHLLIEHTTGYESFGIDGGGTAIAHARVVDFDPKDASSSNDLILGDGDSDYMAVLWDLGQYYDSTKAAPQTVTLSAGPIANKIFIVKKGASDLDFYKTKVFDFGNDDQKDLLVVPKGGTEIHIIWDLASHKADTTVFTLDTANAAKFFSVKASATAFAQGEFSSIDLDGDGSNDLYASFDLEPSSTDQKLESIIFWGSEFENDSGVKRTDSITIDYSDGTATMFTGSSDNPADGLWFKLSSSNADTTPVKPTLEDLSNNFYFVDVNDDGFRDAVYKTAKTDGDYDVWRLAGTKNVFVNLDDLSQGFVGTGNKTTISKADLNILGIYPGYYRKDVNDDNTLDFIAKAANPALDGGKVYHNVWYGTAAAFDDTAAPDAWVEITTAAGGGLADGADTFQLVDIA